MVTRDYFPPQVGGISTMMAEIAARLGPQRVSCLVGAPGASLQLAAAAGDVPVRVYRSAWPFSRNRLVKLAALGTVWANVLLRERPDVLQFATCDDAYWGSYLHRLLGLPFIVYAHGNDILAAETAAWHGARTALSKAAVVLANSSYTAGLLKSRLGVRDERVRLLHPGCDTARFFPGEAHAEPFDDVPALRSAAPVLLTVGNLVERKGHDLVIKCLPELRKRWPDLRYVIVGDGPSRGSLAALAQLLGVPDAVCFVGRVSAERLPAFYRRCDVMVMPSRLRADRSDVEGFGIVFIEANACGKPVIGGRSGGVEDAILDGVTGFLVDPASIEDLTLRLQLLLSEKALAARLGAQGAARAAQELSWQAVAKRVGDIVDAVAERGADTRPS